MAQNEVRIVITGDPKRLQSSLSTASVAVGRFGDDVDRHGSRWDGLKQRLIQFGQTAGIVLAAAGIAAAKWGFDAARSAADYGESLNKLNVLMGTSMTPKLEEWAEANIKSLGMSKKAVIDTAAQFTLFGSAMGLQGDQLLGFNESLVQLTADLGSFNNLPTAEVSEMISAAFRGEYDSLQRIVPMIDNATIVKRALAMTGKDSADSLTQEEKAMATYWEILSQTTSAQGDFLRTQDSAPNRMKQVEAAYENLRIQVGEKLLPILVELLDWFVEDAWPWLETNVPKWKRWWDENITPTIAKINEFMHTFMFAMEFVRVDLISVLVSVINFKLHMQREWQQVQDKVAATVGAIRWTWDALVGFISGIPGRVGSFLSGMWQSAASSLGGVVQWIRGGWEGVVSFVSGIPDRITGLFSGAGGWLQNAGRAIMDGLLSGLRSAWEKVRSFVSGLGNAIKSLKGPIDYDMRLLIPEGRAIMSGLQRGLAAGFDTEVRPELAAITGDIGSPGRWQSAGGASGGVGGNVTHLHFHGPVSRDSEAWLLDVLARANRSGAAAIPGVR